MTHIEILAPLPLPQFLNLDLSEKRVGERDGHSPLFSTLQQLPRLQSLRLRGCYLTYNGFTQIASIIQFLPQKTGFDLRRRSCRNNFSMKVASV